jgi:hypothetical protein
MRVRHDYTGVDREGFAPDDPFFHAAPRVVLKNPLG